MNRLRRWLRPPRILRPTRAGWCFFGITLCVGFAALNTGNNLLYLVLSLMLAFLVLSGVLSESALRGIQVRRRLPAELAVGATTSVGLEIHNAQRRVPAFAVFVEDCFPAKRGRPLDKAPAAGRSFCIRIAPGATEHRRYTLTPTKRGSLNLAGFRVATRFPFGLFLKVRVLTLPDELLVYPALDAAAPAAARSSDAEDEGARQSANDAGADVAGIRAFEPGDPLRRVHWRTSLRRGQLLLREVEDVRGRRVEVRLRTAGQGADERFEGAVSKAASQVARHLERGDRVALVTDGEEIPAATGTGQRARLLAHLARIEPGGAA